MSNNMYDILAKFVQQGQNSDAPVEDKTTVAEGKLAQLMKKLDKNLRGETLTESRHLDEAESTFTHIQQRFPAEVKRFERTNELDEDLQDALYDYYLNAGEMPYRVAKGRDQDPGTWISERFAQDLGINEEMLEPTGEPEVVDAVPPVTAEWPEEVTDTDIEYDAGYDADSADMWATMDDPDTDIPQPRDWLPEDEYDASAESSASEDCSHCDGTGEYYDADAQQFMWCPECQGDFPELEDDTRVMESDDDITGVCEKCDDTRKVDGDDCPACADEELDEGCETCGGEDCGCDETVNEDISVSVNAVGEEDTLALIRKLSGLPPVQPTVDDAAIVAVDTPCAMAEEVDEDEDRDIEYANTPDEDEAPLDAAIPSGDDFHRSKQQDTKTANPAANPLTPERVTESTESWKQYRRTLSAVAKKSRK